MDTDLRRYTKLPDEGLEPAYVERIQGQRELGRYELIAQNIIGNYGGNPTFLGERNREYAGRILTLIMETVGKYGTHEDRERLNLTTGNLGVLINRSEENDSTPLSSWARAQREQGEGEQ